MRISLIMFELEKLLVNVITMNYFEITFNKAWNASQHNSRGKIPNFKPAYLNDFHIALDMQTQGDTVNENDKNIDWKSSSKTFKVVEGTHVPMCSWQSVIKTKSRWRNSEQLIRNQRKISIMLE